MLSPSTLERVSSSYRRGYYAAYDGAPAIDPHPSTGLGDRPFSNYDFAEGYKAGANDLHWETVHRGLACDIKNRICGMRQSQGLEPVA